MRMQDWIRTIGSRLALVILVSLVVPSIAAAQDAAPADDPPVRSDDVSAAELDELIATLEDESQRQALVAQLQALREARMAADGGAGAESLDRLGATALSYLSERSVAIGRQLTALGEILADIPQAVASLRVQVSDAESRQRLLDVLTNLGIVLGASLVGLWLVAYPLRRRREALERRAIEGVTGRIAVNLGLMLFGLAPLLVFVLVANAALVLVDPRPETRIVVLATVNALLVRGLLLESARLVLVPSSGGRRLVRLQDETAVYLYVWAKRLSTVIVFGYVISETGLLLGMTGEAHQALVDLLGIIVAGMLIVLVAQNRGSVAATIRGAGDGQTASILRRRLADIWHLLAFGYVLVSVIIWLLDIGGGAVFVVRATVLTVVVLLLVGMLFAGAHRLIGRGLSISPDLKDQFPGLEARANRYLPALERIVQAVIVLAALASLLEIWSLGGFAILSTEFGRGLAASVVSIAASLLVAVLVWELISNAVERRLSEVGEDGKPLVAAGRARTLLPLLRKAVFVVLATVVTLIVLSEIGVNIAPLLAGAGIVGLAVGFGAQTLVKDIITGLFILMEDTIAVGDVVNVGGHAGLVEAISLRTLSLRDLSGVVHTVPYSQVDTVMNLTKDFSFYVMEIGISYREDTDHVIEVLKQVGAELLNEQKFAIHILEPLEILGVDQFADSAVIIKARIKTKPIKQWFVGREFNRRMKKRFDELGIEIPFPHMTLYFGQDKAGNAPAGNIRVDSDAAATALSAGREALKAAES